MSTVEQQPIIRIEKVGKWYGHFQVLTDIDLDVRAGDTYENKLVLKQQFMAVALRQGQPDLLKTVDDFVAKHTADGELNKLYRKWLQTDLPALPAL